MKGEELMTKVVVATIAAVVPSVVVEASYAVSGATTAAIWEYTYNLNAHSQGTKVDVILGTGVVGGLAGGVASTVL